MKTWLGLSLMLAGGLVAIFLSLYKGTLMPYQNMVNLGAVLVAGVGYVILRVGMRSESKDAIQDAMETINSFKANSTKYEIDISKCTVLSQDTESKASGVPPSSIVTYPMVLDGSQKVFRSRPIKLDRETVQRKLRNGSLIADLYISNEDGSEYYLGINES